MNPVGKALWYIESHFAEEISPRDIAAVCDVSRHHMSRAFGLAAGRSVMRYARVRRLTQAARTLSLGAPDSLSVALDAGYGSHEAFTRALRDQFGVTPEAVRARGDLDNLEPVEPIKMNETGTVELEEPRRVLRSRRVWSFRLGVRCRGVQPFRSSSGVEWCPHSRAGLYQQTETLTYRALKRHGPA